MSLDIGDTLLMKHLSWMILHAVKQEMALLQQFLSVHVKQKVRRCSSTLPDLNLQTAASTVGKLHEIITKTGNIEPPESPDRTKKIFNLILRTPI